MKDSSADSGNILRLQHSVRDMGEIRAIEDQERQPGAGSGTLRRKT